MLCCRVQNLLSAYCDRELTGAEMLQIRKHLNACPACQREHAAIAQMKTLLGALAAAEPRTPFRPDMLDAAPQPAVSRLARAAGILPTPGQHPPHPLTRLRRLLAPGTLWTTLRRWNSIVVPRTQAFTAMAGTMAVTVLAVSLVQKPQPPDAVAAHVGESIALGQVVPAATPESVLELAADRGPLALAEARPGPVMLAHFPGEGHGFSGRVYSGYAVPVSARPGYHHGFAHPTFATFSGPAR